MKIIFKLLFGFLALIIIISCSHITTKQSDYILNLELEKADTAITLSQILADDYEFILLETGPECIIGSVSKIHITCKAIYVLDAFMSKRLYKFDRDGKYLFSFGINDSLGGNYSKPYDFTYDRVNGHIYILEAGNYVLKYDENAKFLNAVNIVDLGYSAFLLEKMEKGFAFISGQFEDDLILTDEKFHKTESYFPFENNSMDKVLISPIQNINDSIIVFRRFLNDQIYRLEKDKLIPHVDLDFNHTYPSALFEKSTSRNAFNKVLQDSEVSVLKLYFETTESVYFTFSVKNKPYLGFYNKLSDQLKYSSLAYFTNDVTFDYRSSYVIGTFEDKFVFYVQPQNLIDGLETDSIKFGNSVYYEKAMEMSRLLNGKSNPVLLISGIKDLKQKL